MADLPDHHRVFLNEQFPFFVRYIDHLIQEQTEEAPHNLEEFRETLPHVLEELMELKRHVPKGFALEKKIITLEFDSARLGEHIQHLDAVQVRDELTHELKVTLERAFDIKQQQRRFEAEQIDRELRDIQTLIEKRQENRELIIGRRLGDLIGRPDVYEWSKGKRPSNEGATPFLCRRSARHSLGA